MLLAMPAFSLFKRLGQEAAHSAAKLHAVLPDSKNFEAGI